MICLVTVIRPLLYQIILLVDNAKRSHPRLRSLFCHFTTSYDPWKSRLLILKSGPCMGNLDKLEKSVFKNGLIVMITMASTLWFKAWKPRFFLRISSESITMSLGLRTPPLIWKLLLLLFDAFPQSNQFLSSQMTPLYRWSCAETSRGCIGSSGPTPNPSFKDSCI